MKVLNSALKIIFRKTTWLKKDFNKKTLKNKLESHSK